MSKKIPQITNGLKSAVKAFIMAKAWTETVKPIVEGYQTRILAEKQYPISQETKERCNKRGGIGFDVILTSDHTHYMEDADFDQYLALVKVEHLKNFPKLADEIEKGFCPLLMAQSDQREAAHLIIQNAEYITKVNLDQVTRLHPAKYKEFIDLTVKFVMSACPEIGKELQKDFPVNR